MDVIIHRWLICEKKKSRSKQWSGVCGAHGCKWLKFDDNGIAKCSFCPIADKRAGKHKDKLKQKREEE